jgi:transposase
MSSMADERVSAIHLLRAGLTTAEVGERLERSEQWVRKWWRRYRNTGWSGLTRAFACAQACGAPLIG